VFEVNKCILYDDDDADYDDELEDHAEPVMIHPHELPDDDNHAANELQNEFAVPGEERDEVPGHYEPHDIVDQLLEEIDNVLIVMMMLLLLTLMK
jgi:hypothetical protein